FQSYAHHTDLHSFPTRRSSDLEGKGHWFFPLPRPKKLVVKPGQFVVLLRGRYSAVESLNIVRCEPAISPACPVDSGSPSGHTNVIAEEQPPQRAIGGRVVHHGGDNMGVADRVNVKHPVRINVVQVDV